MQQLIPDNSCIRVSRVTFCLFYFVSSSSWLFLSLLCTPPLRADEKTWVVCKWSFRTILLTWMRWPSNMADRQWRTWRNAQVFLSLYDRLCVAGWCRLVVSPLLSRPPFNIRCDTTLLVLVVTYLLPVPRNPHQSQSARPCYRPIASTSRQYVLGCAICVAGKQHLSVI